MSAKMYDKTKIPAPSHYLRRNPNILGKNGYSNWEQCGWGKLKPGSFARAEKLVQMFNSSFSYWQYKLPLYCERCFATILSETYPATGLEAGMIGKHVCYTCHIEGLENMKKPAIKPKGISKSEYEAYGFGPGTQPATKPATARKEGDIWTIPQGNSPFNSQQWAYQGSAKAPYIITRYATKRDGATTSDGWACSCMNFTRHTPRTPCKHILNIMIKAGVAGVDPVKAKLANVDEKKLKAFEKWNAEQEALKAGNKPSAGVKLNLFGVTTRKFR